MFWEIDFAFPPPDQPAYPPPQSFSSQVTPAEIESLYVLHWREHCLECSPPDCYESCQLYVRRRDQRCSRLVYGIFPNQAFQGIYGYGADLRFRRWGNIGAKFGGRAVSPSSASRLDRLNRAVLGWLVNPLAGGLAHVDRERWTNRLFVKWREQFLRHIGQPVGSASGTFDYFLLETWSMEPADWKLMLEVRQGGSSYREAITLRPGHNLHSVPFHYFDLDLSRSDGSIRLFPENDTEARAVLLWATFVRRKRKISHRVVVPASKPAKPATKVKCVVWDLDNTLWSGTLVEDGAEGVRLRSESAGLIRDLDERGIIQSVASKNDFDDAWRALRDLGLDEYFLYPAIHWGPKSQSLRWIAEKLNIGIDSLALIDDSDYERSEVASVLPQVRAYSDTAISNLLVRPEFDVPVTEASRARRRSYLGDKDRERFAAAYGDNHIRFLRACELSMEVFTPSIETEIRRCFELLMRTNQLNLATHRYAEEEFRALLADPDILALAWRVKDRFGDYGIVGFATICFGNGVARLQDFLLSCRVARKKVENAWFNWAAGLIADQGFQALSASYVPTERNGVLLKVLREVGFEETRRHAGGELELSLKASFIPPHHDVVALRELAVGTITGGH